MHSTIRISSTVIVKIAETIFSVRTKFSAMFENALENELVRNGETAMRSVPYVWIASWSVFF